jgi:hypothetical protein
MTTAHRIALIIVALFLSGGLVQLAGAQQTYQESSPFGPAMGTTVEQEPLPVAPEPVSDLRPSAVPMSAQPGDVIEDPAATLPDRSRQILEYQGLRYLSGGVGEDERSEIETLGNQFNLRLMFAKQDSGEYLADVHVSIKEERSGTILDARSDGPLFFAQLPAGDYRVEATPSGMPDRMPQSKTVHVGSSGQSRLDFYWK